ncbi:SRPBCC domain-containing protein [Ktedonosporobacter rubrisoli]|uniref:SRPBCC domain-containing protein n=1 Tax=Ktedonosporobacter rubrisoli TaxID=2509675 RepID=A0A4P6JVM4_KTERU|nr:SRPBCC domain-containing protein [Ktedonosporobacter rubrisoli]QBD79423.1 SRPBCC domain-containing protein [Ktedonosporobacter rubrisoli]
MAITQLPSGFDSLLIEATFPSTQPSLLFRYWIEPEKLPQWWSWPQEIEIQPYQGGTYHLGAPQKNWHLRGSYTLFDFPRQLAFTWRWDHDPAEDMTREVNLTFEPLGSEGTRLRLRHGPYENTARDQELRVEDHLAGWNYFLPRLQNLFA